MANPNKLHITYHPAKRDILFKVLENENEVKNDYETLKKYSVGEKGKFVLNLYGNDFFNDILKPFRGKDFVEIYLKTTRLDYEDFKQRVNEYNKNKSINDSEIRLLPLPEGEELVDMKTSFNEIKVQGEKIVKLLDSHWNTIQNIKCTSNNAKDYLMKVAEKIRKEKEGIEKNLKSLSEDNNVNICIIGSVSSGKSSLINTLLGYKIMPVGTDEKTAKMFKIKGVKTLADSFIKFSEKSEKEDKNRLCYIKWDFQKKCFCITDSNIIEENKKKIISVIEANKEKRLDAQFYSLLNCLNDINNIDAQVDIGFPIEMDTDDIHFTIYDTPGSDGNLGYNKKILSETLRDRTNSISIFVFTPTTIDGSGNKELLQELLEKHENSSNRIDLEQSFFVINQADTNKGLKDIKNKDLYKYKDDPNPIKLSDKKVFFVSSQNGFASVSHKNNVAGDDEKFDLRQNCPGSYDEVYGRYYQHNHYGKSEYATQLLISEANTALNKAVKVDYYNYVCI